MFALVTLGAALAALGVFQGNPIAAKIVGGFAAAGAVLGALAISGLFLLVMGLRRRQTAYGRWLLEQGAAVFLVPTVLNFMVGLWFLMLVPRGPRMLFMGGNVWATVLLALGIVLPLAALGHLVMLRAGKAPVRQAVVAIAAGVLTVAVMVLIRDVLRNG